jgi:ABC-type antimicrobial peptide transport system permease subunit
VKKDLQDIKQIVSFRVLPGDDVSCLNLYQPQKPRILGVPESQIERGGFSFSDSLASSAAEKNNPWLLLNRDLGPGIIPAIGDENSVNWILHLSLGKDMTISDGSGNPLHLRIVGLLRNSIFQSELLTSSNHFLKYFPDQMGYSYFLVESPAQKTDQVEQALESSLSDFGFDATKTSVRLASYEVVQNTYLSTFQTLGALGLLLGTLGLGIILVRNVIERRGELATLRAFGFNRSILALLVVTENGVLLLSGILIGAVSALIAVSPHLFQSGSNFPWVSLSFTLLIVFLIGMIASVVATVLALRIPLLPALKAE